MTEPSFEPPPDSESPPRAFTQGVGLVFQWFGVLLFIVSMFVCCTSSLLSRDTATHSETRAVGWHFAGDAPNRPTYSAQLAITLCVTLGVFFGMAMAGMGLGLQAQNRRTPALAVIITILAALFWIGQTAFFAGVGQSIFFALLCAILAIAFIVCAGFAIAAARDMRRNPPADSFETLPKDFKIPYSHMHQDGPDVRLAAELAERRERLEIQQKELESLEERIRKRMKQSEP